ncbi:MAG: hypothetical protein ACI8TX_000787 [Hyphomicrobiaceae bacterium]|jgi:hypothetical protein
MERTFDSTRRSDDGNRPRLVAALADVWIPYKTLHSLKKSLPGVLLALPSLASINVLACEVAEASPSNLRRRRCSGHTATAGNQKRKRNCKTPDTHYRNLEMLGRSVKKNGSGNDAGTDYIRDLKNSGDPRPVHNTLVSRPGYWTRSHRIAKGPLAGEPNLGRRKRFYIF